MDGNITSEGSENTLYLTQIRYLEEELDRFKLRYDEVEKQNDGFTSQYEALEREKNEKWYLKCHADTRDMKVEFLDQLELHYHGAKKNMEALKLQHSQKLQPLRKELDKLNTDLQLKAARQAKEEEQLLELKQQLSEVDSLQKQLKHQREKHEAAINKLKKDEELEMMGYEKLQQALINDQIDKEREKIQEEMQVQFGPEVLAAQQQYMSRDKEELRDRGNAARTMRDELQEHTEELAGRNHVCFKVKTDLKNSYLDEGEELQLCDDTFKCMLGNQEDLRSELTALHELNGQKTAELDHLELELQRQRNRVKMMKGSKLEAAVIFRHIWALKTQHQDQEEQEKTRWKTERLLDLLENTAPREKTPPSDSSREDPDPEAATSADA